MTLGRRRGDRGMAVVFVAVGMVAVLAVAAIVVDAGQLRTDRRVNKAIADMSAVAGAWGMKVSTWEGLCDAYSYLLANAREFSSFQSEAWTRGDGSIVSTSTGGPCTTPPASPLPNSCVTADSSTWARFDGSAAGGRISVSIRAGYGLPDSTFPEDAQIAGDNGEPCDHVAVLISEQRPPAFSGVVGIGTSTTRIRSVARLIKGTADIAALVVLEKHKCSLNATTNGGKIDILSKDARPGIIHVDSDGTQCQNGSSRVVEGSALPAAGGANIIARATTSPNPYRPGEIQIYASRVNPAWDYTEPTCPDPGPAYPSCTITPTPIGSGVLGRLPLDERYLAGVRALDATAASAFAAPPAAEFTTCNPAGNVDVTDVDVYVNCNVLKLTNGTVLRFKGRRGRIVFKGRVDVESGAVLELRNPAEVFLYGETGQNKKGLAVAGSLEINANGFSACKDRGNPGQSNSDSEPGNADEVTRLVVAEGAFDAGAGGVVRMCQTTLLMGAGSLFGGANVAVDNDYEGWVSVGGQGAVDWTAPNKKQGAGNLPNQADWNNLEDLALWTEAGQGSTISGVGGVKLQGVFALPNSGKDNDWFTIGGQGVQNISADAQFWTRRLRLAGQALLTMSPNPEDSIPFQDVALVR